MVYNDVSGGQGILQDVEDKCDFADTYITSDTARLKSFARKAKKVGAELWFIVWKNSGPWQYDDSNNTDLPQAVTDLTSGTYKYALPSEALTVNKLEILDRNGKFVRLSVLDVENLGAIDYSVTGQPSSYHLVNGTIFFNVTPDYTKTGGIKVYFDRANVDLAYNATTATPGIPSTFHYLYPLGMAIDYLKVKQPNSPSLPQYKEDYEKGKLDLGEFISERFGDSLTPTIQMTRQNME